VSKQSMFNTIEQQTMHEMLLRSHMHIANDTEAFLCGMQARTIPCNLTDNQSVDYWSCQYGKLA